MNNATVLIIGGAGAVGSLFCRLSLEHYQHIMAIDLRCDDAEKIEGVEYLQSDINDPLVLEKVRESQLIILATPEEPAIKFIQAVGQMLLPGQCLIDTMSVKSTIASHLEAIPRDIEVLSINPMFGPSLGFKNQSVAYIEVNGGPISTHFLSMIRQAGSSVVAFSAEEHDRNTAATQVATHAAILAFGMTLIKMDYKSDLAEPIWTPPHKTLLALLARVLSADPEVYRDIQASNPYAEEARNAMKDSLIKLDHSITGAGHEEFDELFKQLKTLLNSNMESLSGLSQTIFEQLDSS